jgi:hypothetical protein
MLTLKKKSKKRRQKVKQAREPSAKKQRRKKERENLGRSRGSASQCVAFLINLRYIEVNLTILALSASLYGLEKGFFLGDAISVKNMKDSESNLKLLIIRAQF